MSEPSMRCTASEPAVQSGEGDVADTVKSLISGESAMEEQDNARSRAGWVGMLVFAAGFAGLGVWGIVTDQVAWGIGSVLFGLVWGFVALRARRKVTT